MAIAIVPTIPNLVCTNKSLEQIGHSLAVIDPICFNGNDRYETALRVQMMA